MSPTVEPTQGPVGRVLLTATHSGGGKTTVTVSVIAALTARGLPVAAFKCGPDYIDPMFLSAALGVPARNLDPFFSTADELRQQLVRFTHGSGADTGRFAVIEGVMGYYDGLGITTSASTFAVATATTTPAILVLDASGMAASAGAIIAGFTSYRTPSGIAGVIVNRTTDRGYALIEPLIREAGLTPLGFLPKTDAVTWPSRRLGLVTAAELDNLQESIRHLADLAESHLDLDALVDLGTTAPDLSPTNVTSASASTTAARPPHHPSHHPDVPSPDQAVLPPGVTLAVARDEAFCFAYPDTLDLFEALGATLVFFSPLHDERPPAADALYLPGGYPELHATALSDNQTMRAAIKLMVESGIPTIAECGGFMYLHDDIDGHPMVGIIPAHATAGPSLRHFGYTTLRPTTDNLLVDAGESLVAHEFHYYDSTDPGDGFIATKASTSTTYPTAHATPTMYAGFPHLYLPSSPHVAQRFLAAAHRYSTAHRRATTPHPQSHRTDEG